MVSFVRGTSPFVGLQNFSRVLLEPLFHRVLFNTLIFTSGSILFQFAIGLGLALVFERPFPLRAFYQGLVMLPAFIPVLVSGAVWRWFLADGGTLNGVLRQIGLIRGPIPWTTSVEWAIYAESIAIVWIGIPFNFLLLLTGLQSIPRELYECAEIDGARGWQRVAYISLPLLRPVIVTTLMLGAIFTVKVFDLVWVLTRGGPGGSTHLFSTLAYSLGFEQFRFGRSAAVTLIMVFLVTVLTLGFLRIRIED